MAFPDSKPRSWASSIRNSPTVILRCICSTFLLFLPSCYASQASSMIFLTEGLRFGHHGLPLRNTTNTTSTVHDRKNVIVTTNKVDEWIELRAVPTLCRPKPAHLGVPYPSTNYYPAIPESIAPSPPRDPGQLHINWCSYIDSRCREWSIIATSAWTFVAESPAILQMPGTDGEPITRFFVFVALFRIIAAIVYATILLLYFRRKQSKTGQFSTLWFRDVKRHQDSILHMPWTMLALPAIAFCWGVIFFIVALFCSIWGTGFAPSASTRTREAQPLTDVILRTFITLVSVLDVMCTIWILQRLRRLNDIIHCQHT